MAQGNHPLTRVGRDERNASDYQAAAGRFMAGCGERQLGSFSEADPVVFSDETS